MRLRYLSLLAIVFAAAVSSCNKDNKPDPYEGDVTRRFFPLDKGHYVTYQVDSVIYSEFAGGIATPPSYYVRYTIVDTFSTPENGLSYRIDVHSKRKYPVDSVPFRLQSTFYVTPTATALDYTRGTVRFTKLVFPIANDTHWDGNAAVPFSDSDFSYYRGWDYHYTNAGETYNNGLATFENTVNVKQVDRHTGGPATTEQAYAEHAYSREVYADKVGMIYQEQTHYVYDRSPLTGTYSRVGYQVVMRAFEHN